MAFTPMVGGISMMMVGLFGVLGPTSLSLPPMEPDPKLAQVAPESAMLYARWAGAAAADGDSANATERLIAEPQVQRLLDGLEDAATGAFRRAVERGGERGAFITQHVPTLAKAIMTRPIALYVESIEPAAHQNPPNVTNIKAGLVINLGDRARPTVDIIQRLLGVDPKPAGDDQPARRIDGVRVHATGLFPGKPLTAHWGATDSHLFIALGDGSAEHIVSALKADDARPPRWLREAQDRVAVERRADLSYVNIRALIETVRRQMGQRPGGPGLDGDQMDAMIAALGVDRLRSAAATSGLDGGGFVRKTFIEIEGDEDGGDLPGLLGLLDAEPLKPADLHHIPADAQIALAARFDAADAIQRFRRTLGQIDPRAAQQWDRGLAELREETGLRLVEDVLAPLGTRWSVFDSAAEGRAVLGGLVASVDVRDPVALEQTIKQVEAMIAPEPAGGGPNHRRRHGVTIETTEVAGEAVRFFNVRDDEMPFAPAWHLGENRLLIALYPQAIRGDLRRFHAEQPGDSLPDHDRVAALFEGDDAPLLISRIDTPSLVRTYYPLLYPAAALFAGELQQEGINLNMSLLPETSAIVRHLRPGVGRMTRTADGLMIESRGTLPVGGMAELANPMTLGMAGGAAVPAFFRARAQAQQVQEMARLRQVAMVIHAYAADHDGELPPDLETLKRKDYLAGKADRVLRDRHDRPFIYLHDGGKLNEIANPGETPLVAGHPRRGKRNVAYLDGHAELVPEPRFQKQLKEAGLELPPEPAHVRPRNPPGAEHALSIRGHMEGE